MKTVAVIGAGISGLTVAQRLKDRFNVKVFEKESRPGGLIKCERIDGYLYHKVGGHVFNSKQQNTLDWFWRFFDKENEFVKAERNAIIAMPDSSLVGYPIENHIYMLKSEYVQKIVGDLLSIAKNGDSSPENFEDFLIKRFGSTLFSLYFCPYNEKIWKTDLKNIPLSWLSGKLPMPTVEDIIYNNFCRAGENKMVHSAFYYPRNNGSQFIANRLAENLNIAYSSPAVAIKKTAKQWTVNAECFDMVVFCGNIKDLPSIMSTDIKNIDKLTFHGTTTVLCEIEQNPYSWIYLPSQDYAAHRIICTGNFSVSNNADGKMSGTVEFTDKLDRNEINLQLAKIPFFRKYITHQYTPCTYPVQDAATRQIVSSLKEEMATGGFYFTGRFADWEYYNMDAAIDAAMLLADKILTKNS
ncbi:MAG: NAD(P)-binding protein [Prevotellaceae bacterium]|jgi:protoporphyrinogen oxidase|nr:NAD(P)-binding protein [Prevotellaceae bacterium]